MNKSRKIVSFIFICLLFSLFSWGISIESASATAGSANNVLWGGTAEGVQQRTALGNDDPRFIAANIINLVLGFLGILALALILYAGFKWMTAAGNDDKVSEAKKILTAGVIGLVIILAAYALAAFVLDAIFRVTTDTL